MINFKKHNIIAGVDEAGRGPLAGPVVSACVILERKTFSNQGNSEMWAEVKDSKALSKKNRERIYDFLIKNSYEISIGLADNHEIDNLNILYASLLSMKRAVENVKSQLDMIFVDGNFLIPSLDIAQEAIIDGDEKNLIISAASIVAKVTRDRFMADLGKLYPEFSFGEHKGYPTKKHYQELRDHGPCPIHRLTFNPVREVLNHRFENMLG